MHDQADQLRKLVRQAVRLDGSLAPGAPIIAVSGGQPGAGVTTIACGLARELARLGKQVVLIDANLQRPHAAMLLARPYRLASPHTPDPASAGPGHPMALTGSLGEVLAGTRRAVEVLTTVEDGLRLLAGRPGALPLLDREAVDRFFGEVHALSQQADVILIDAGSGMNSWIDRLWQLARGVLLVTTPDSTAVVDSYAAVKLAQFHRLDQKLRLLVNRCPQHAEAAALGRRFEETCRRFLFIGAKPVASLPSSDRDDDATQFRRGVRLLAADLACDFRAVAHRLPREKSNAVSDQLSALSQHRSTPAAHD